MHRLIRFISAYGLTGLYLFVVKRLKFPKQVDVQVKGVDAAISLRTDTSDINIFEQVFVDSEYEFLRGRKLDTIIDAGANIGLASVCFKQINPQAKIIALEPESSNFELLAKNLSAYDQVTPLKMGLWNKATFLKIANPEGVKSGFRLAEVDADDADIETTTVDALIDQLGVDTVDLLKIDIEGGEVELFADKPQWLSRVRMLVIELHDRQVTGCSRALYAAVDPYVEAEYRYGENIVLILNGKS